MFAHSFARPRLCAVHPASADLSALTAASAAALCAPLVGRSPLAKERVLPTRDLKNHTTLVDGYLGMSNDEERSEMRYVVRIAEFSESSNL